MLECEGGAERSGLYYTCINSYLAPDEVAYIINDSEARVVVTSAAKREVAMQLPALCPNVERWLMADIDGADAPFESLSAAATRSSPPIRSTTSSSARRCSTRPARPDNRRASCGTARRASRCSDGGDAVRAGDVPLPRAADLPVAGAALPLGSAGERLGHAAARRHRGDHGEVRSRAVPRSRRGAPHHALADGADDVLAVARSCPTRCAPQQTCRPSRSSSTRRRRVRCR